jgi:hypothetical protein
MKKAVSLLLLIFICSIVYPVWGESTSKPQGNNTTELTAAGNVKHTQKAKSKKTGKKKPVKHKKTKKHTPKPAKKKTHKKK